MEGSRGYPLEIYRGENVQRYKCPLCDLILKKPVRCVCKNHVFCEGCITEHIGNDEDKVCPECQKTQSSEMFSEEIVKLCKNSIVSAHNILEELQSIHFDCPKTGCTWTAKGLFALEHHTVTCLGQELLPKTPEFGESSRPSAEALLVDAAGLSNVPKECGGFAEGPELKSKLNEPQHGGLSSSQNGATDNKRPLTNGSTSDMETLPEQFSEPCGRRCKMCRKDLLCTSDFICANCTFILRQPVQAACGHRLCYECKESLLSRFGVVLCIKCINELSDKTDNNETFDDIIEKAIASCQEKTHADKGAERDMKVLLDQDTSCVWHGCKWIGVYRNFDEHESKHLMSQCETPEMSKPGNTMKNSSEMEDSDVLKMFLVKFIPAVQRKLKSMAEEASECAILRGIVQKLVEENARLTRQLEESGVVYRD